MNFSVHPFARPNRQWCRRFTHKQAIAVHALNEAKLRAVLDKRNVWPEGFVSSCAPLWK